MAGIALGAAGALAAGGLAWSLFEAQWVDLVEREAPVPGLPPELDGVTILHVSDFHLGTRSFNARTLERAVEWVESRPVDLVAVTGDLVSRRRGERTLSSALARLHGRHGTFAVLGNHDVADSRDPLSSPADLSTLEQSEAHFLGHSAAQLEIQGRRVQIAGSDPRRREEPLDDLVDPSADLRVLLTHFPDTVHLLRPGAFQLVLAGHLHGGQICLPTPQGKLRLQHVRAPFWEGLYHLPEGTLHVSRGLGTSFVPFRFLARPEATVLTLRPFHQAAFPGERTTPRLA